MPLKKIAQKPEPQPPQEQEDVEAEQPVLEPSEAQAMEPGRPYQDFVESEVRKYCQEVEGTGSVKYMVPPMAHHAVADVVEHIRKERWTKRPLSEAYDSPTYIDALIQLATDADWLAEELTLPDHPSIYYNRDVKTNKPVPREFYYIRGEYLSEVFGSKLSEDSRIYPSASWRLNIYYSIEDRRGEPSVMIHYQRDEGRGWRDFSGIKQYNESLEDLRLANKKIAALKGSGLSRSEIQAKIYDIRKSYGLH